MMEAIEKQRQIAKDRKKGDAQIKERLGISDNDESSSSEEEADKVDVELERD